MCLYTDVVIGNIFHDSLKNIWNNNKFSKEYRAEKWFPTKCKVCEEFIGCKISRG